MVQSKAVSGQNRYPEKTGCCRAEQFLDKIDSWKIQDAAKQSRSGENRFLGKNRKLQSRAVPGQNIFQEYTGCWRAEHVVKQSNSWIEYIPGVYRMLQSRACRGAEQFVEGKDSGKRQNAAEQNNLWRSQSPRKKNRMLPRRVVVDGKDSWMLQSRKTKKTLLLSTKMKSKLFVLYVK